jgi:hypothetical protein
VTKRGDQAREERRKAQVEVNLLAENESGGRVISKTRRGCTLPFFGGTGLFLIVLEAALRAGVG